MSTTFWKYSHESSTLLILYFFLLYIQKQWLLKFNCAILRHTMFQYDEQVFHESKNNITYPSPYPTKVMCNQKSLSHLQDNPDKSDTPLWINHWFYFVFKCCILLMCPPLNKWSPIVRQADCIHVDVDWTLGNGIFKCKCLSLHNNLWHEF